MYSLMHGLSCIVSKFSLDYIHSIGQRRVYEPALLEKEASYKFLFDSFDI